MGKLKVRAACYKMLTLYMFTDILKESTQQNHLELEKKIIPKLRSIRSESDYVSLLNLFHSYFGGLELKVQSVLDHTLVPDYSQRRKADAILNDIRALGGHASGLVGDEHLPVIIDHATALGAMYVMEGSTLGGKTISKMIAQALPGRAEHALSFYESYGDNSPMMWDKFKAGLNEQVTYLIEQQRVIDSANETFLKFSEWIDKAG